MKDTWYKCTICGRVGTVGRCCGDETREPLNDFAREEQERIKSQNLPKADAYSLLADVRALLIEIVELGMNLSDIETAYLCEDTIQRIVNISDMARKLSEHFS